jgi:hypothetical protein
MHWIRTLQDHNYSNDNGRRGGGPQLEGESTCSHGTTVYNPKEKEKMELCLGKERSQKERSQSPYVVVYFSEKVLVYLAAQATVFPGRPN